MKWAGLAALDATDVGDQLGTLVEAERRRAVIQSDQMHYWMRAHRKRSGGPRFGAD